MYKSQISHTALLLLSLVLPLAGCASDELFQADDRLTAYGGSKAHPIKVANGKATVDPCGEWPKNLGDTNDNTFNANHGCAVQSNIAAMAAYPADLAGTGHHLPDPLGDIQYVALKKLTDGGGAAAGGGTATAGGGAAAP